MATLDTDIETAEDQLASTGTGEASDQLAATEGLRERARGLKALLSERISGLQRDLDRRLDGGVVETLEAEAARLQKELQETFEKSKLLEPSTIEVAEAERHLKEDRNEFQQKLFEDISPNGVEAAETRGKLATIAASIDAFGKIAVTNSTKNFYPQRRKKKRTLVICWMNSPIRCQYLVHKKSLLSKEIDTLLTSQLAAEEKRESH